MAKKNKGNRGVLAMWAAAAASALPEVSGIASRGRVWQNNKSLTKAQRREAAHYARVGAGASAPLVEEQVDA